jgi:hypothetical protein
MDISGGPSSAKAADKPSGGGKGGSGDNQKVKMIVAVVIGILAIAVIGYQVVPGLFSGGAAAPSEPPPQATEPVQPSSPDLAPGTKEPPIVPKPRGSGKRPATPG